MPDMMEEAYLALRWNNHNTIFTKLLNILREQEAYTDVSLACGGRLYGAHKFVLSTCSDYFKDMFSKTPCKHPVVFMKDVTGRDIESLLDFMYKGEVHVPQSELGSLLRTAEGLQVKGLAVPDDAAHTFEESPQPESGSTARSSTAGINRTSNKLTNSSFPVKRKRSLDSNKSAEPPKLTPSQFANKNAIYRTSKATKNRVMSMPELKRFKTEVENKKNNNNTLIGGQFSTDLRESIANSSLSDTKEENGLIPLANIKEEILDPRPDDDAEGSYDPENEEDNSVGDEGDEEGGDENSSPLLPSEGDENSSLPNSEISTPNILTTPFLQAELLQVDLSEDGTQFIIGPGLIGSEASRASSAAEEDIAEGPKKPFACLLCGHTFTRRDNLSNHVKTHTGDRPYMCEYCRKCFSRKDYLKQHERIHTGEKPYACEICSRAFTRKEGLTDHMRCHSDYKAFACETCGKSFKQKCGLRFHKRNYRH